MDFYVYLNGQQQGPLTKEQLQELNIAAETPVWYEGLKDWTPAGQAEGTAWLFNQQTPPPINPQQSEPNVPPYQPQQQYGPTQYAQQQYHEEVPPCPDNNLGWAIAVTVLCCVPFGIVAIIKAASVNDKYNRGDYDGAVAAAKSARNWSIIGAICSVVFWAIYIIGVFVFSLYGINPY
jgi:hypothetical protein